MKRTLKKLYKGAEELYIHRRTRAAMKVAADRLKAIHSAWTDAGPVPDYHEHMKYKLRRDWPALAEALDKLEATD